jgi:hypothetical protein
MNATRISLVPRLRATCVVWLMALASALHAQDAPRGQIEPVTAIMERMAGTWSVQQRMWTGPDAQPTVLPPAVATRRLISNAYLEEVMEPAHPSAQPDFRRVAYLNYNAMNRQYEYFSLDSRAPQMMSYDAPGANTIREGKLELSGGIFVAPEWGPAKNVPFIYRLAISEVEDGRQIVQLYLTTQSPSAKEFLAFEYVYVRRR